MRIHCVAPRPWFVIRVSTVVFLRGERGCGETNFRVGLVGSNAVPTLALNPVSCRLSFSSISQSSLCDLTVVYINIIYLISGFFHIIKDNFFHSLFMIMYLSFNNSIFFSIYYWKKKSFLNYKKKQMSNI